MKKPGIVFFDTPPTIEEALRKIEEANKKRAAREKKTHPVKPYVIERLQRKYAYAFRKLDNSPSRYKEKLS